MKKVGNIYKGQGILVSLRIIVIIAVVSFLPLNLQSNLNVLSESSIENSFSINALRAYTRLNDFDLSFDAFLKAYQGYELLLEHHKLGNDSLITIIDFSKPSNDERFFVINMHNQRILFKSLVAHGKNSGEVFASSFSNEVNSLKSSLGFFITDQTYIGKHGYSLLLNGIENGLNDNARERAIVVHGADYVSKDYIAENGRLGRSFGCPALPEKITPLVINLIKGGSCMYLYHPAYNTSVSLALN